MFQFCLFHHQNQIPHPVIKPLKLACKVPELKWGTLHFHVDAGKQLHAQDLTQQLFCISSDILAGASVMPIMMMSIASDEGEALTCVLGINSVRQRSDCVSGCRGRGTSGV